MHLYTIGHSTKAFDELVDILRANGIDIVVDVRRFPRSKKNPQFNQEELKAKLPSTGMSYLWLGDLLGGYRKGGYESYTKTEEFERGINTLLDVATKGRTAIMCAEAVWFRCHRRFISDKLVEMGHEVTH
ncbi:MAG: DUF488 family protein, partial [Candidatus Hydrothermarchaeales archaeon]